MWGRTAEDLHWLEYESRFPLGRGGNIVDDLLPLAKTYVFPGLPAPSFHWDADHLPAAERGVTVLPNSPIETPCRHQFRRPWQRTTWLPSRSEIDTGGSYNRRYVGPTDSPRRFNSRQTGHRLHSNRRSSLGGIPK